MSDVTPGSDEAGCELDTGCDLDAGRLLGELAPKLWIGAVALVLLHLVALAWDETSSFNALTFFLAKCHLDAEHSVSAWFGAFLLLAGAWGWMCLGRVERARDGRDGWRYTTMAWVFVLLSLDETAGVHELMARPVRERLDLGGALFFAWVVPAMAMLAGLAALMWPMVRRMEPTLRRGVIVAACVYLGGAVGLEMVGGAIYAGGVEASDAEAGKTAGYLIALTLEESLEMLGMLWLIRAMGVRLSATAADHSTATPRVAAMGPARSSVRLDQAKSMASTSH